MPQEKLDAYEHHGMFHGTHPDVIDKIVENGFNRSFCGKNGTNYGNGVYFATRSRYSNDFSNADAHGVKHMFVCSVLAGEYQGGRQGQIQPDERIGGSNKLYDSTTDSLDAQRRNMFVVYHDAQAYPHYLIEYRVAA